ncbi:MAG: TRL-like family protein [Pseudomonadota bacterium]
MKKILLAAIILGTLSACTPAITSNGVTSGFYTTWHDRDPISRLDNNVTTTKKGTSCVTNILGLYTSGDSSIDSAKKDGGIKSVSYVDRTYDGLWFFYQKGCTIVKGN